ncbi:MAG: methyltransferase domain-containing protein [Methanoregula sp.]|nr:methyltransferase domain-containing protein [Methanoregula sp.]
MLENILNIMQQTDFDFRKYTNPNDKLSYLFSEWVPYYRMKYAICKAINPHSILEVGVRYGYSAITFLSASQNATYLGIDNDTNTYGGTQGAIEWAKKITKNSNATFLIANTQEMESLPGEHYDLIHIDGQQDGDGTFHDLELALQKAKWILVDGYFWSQENMISSTYFLNKYKQFIEYAIIIPSYAGDLLIKTKESAKNIRFSRKTDTDQTIREEYDQIYFLQDCGGYNSFKKYQGRQVTDERLLAALYLASPAHNKSILDIGCGRGELCYALAQLGANVTGIDYSSSAISIAEKTFHDAIKKDKLKFICIDFLQFNFDKKFDRIIATDFIEHIEKSRYDLVLRKVAGLLKPGGLFILHTSPNVLNFEAPYQEKRAIARSIGSYLPKNPRTYYEDIMHINEQSPDSIKKNLEKHFPYSIVWVATAPDIVGSLGRVFLMNETINARSIFAIASDSMIEHSRILNQLIQNPLDTNKLAAKISCGSYPANVAPHEHFSVEITIDNLSDERWVSLPPNPVHLAYHWLDEKREIIVFDGMRTVIRYPLLPGEKRTFSIDVIAPPRDGNNILQVTLVQEGCFWFEKFVRDLPVFLKIKTKRDK